MTNEELRAKAIEAALKYRENSREVHRVMFPHADEQKLWDESTGKANIMARFILSIADQNGEQR